MENKKGLYEALNKFQSENQSLERTSEVDFVNKMGRRTKYSYVDLSAILDYALPQLSKHGLVLTTESVYRELSRTERKQGTDGTVVATSQVVKLVHGIKATLTHASSGESINEECYFENDTADIKEFGAYLTYKRRYAIMTLLSLSAKDEDSDTNGGERKEPAKPEKAPAKKAPNEDAIKAEFAELGLDSPEAKEALTAVGIGSMTAAIQFRKKYESTAAMISAVMEGK